ncbi:MCM-domain-containing protein [Rhizoctonia solani]|nr:MCM-domain-containing protein [Rhizoctonia solani]
MKYGQQLLGIANRQQNTLAIELDDILEYERTSSELVARIKSNIRRYRQIFCEVVDELMPEPTRNVSHLDDALDKIMHQRAKTNARSKEVRQVEIPTQLLRRYHLCFLPLSSDVALTPCEVQGKHLGKLITITGIVTRVSEVKSLLLVNVYTCDNCGSELFQDISQKQFIPLTDCPSDRCAKDEAGKGGLHMEARVGRFSAFQEARVEEIVDQVPVKRISRSMVVHLYGERTRKLSSGDLVRIGGAFLRTHYGRYQTLHVELLTDTYLEAHSIHQLGNQYEEIELTPNMEMGIERLKTVPRLYGRLVASIAPEIYGHEDVKKAILLLLVAGVTKNMGNGLKIRGDINVCLMGLPAVAKSQLLKYISKVAPRGVYNTGKGGSTVGLTAVVMKDPMTEEMVLEGGSLLLTDRRIRCIDESRFDIVFSVLDEPIRGDDPQYVQYATEVHMYGRHPELFGFVRPTLMQHYIAQARLHCPRVPAEVSKHIAKSLVHLHKEQEENDRNLYTSTRTFHAVVRLSQALARLRFADMVLTADADEALRIIEDGEESLKQITEEGEGDQNVAIRIFRLIKSMTSASRKGRADFEPGGERDTELDEMEKEGGEIMHVSMVDLRAQVLAKGFTEEQLMDAIEQYESINVITLSENGQLIFFVDADEDWEG